MTHSTPSELIRGLAALAVCILLAVPFVAAAQIWTDPQSGDTWTTDPQTCGPRFDWFGESWVLIRTWTDPQTAAVWTTDPRATGSPFNGWGCSWVEILVWVDPATGATWTTDPSAVGPTWTGWGHTWTNIGSSFAQRAYIKASNTDAGDAFGEWVALSGDTLAVGAPFEASNATGIDGDQSDNSAELAGAVYVFTRDGAGVWSQQAYIKGSNTDAGDEFGLSVALAGDTLVVGARLETSAATGIDGDQSDNSAFDAGAVYVFTRDGAGVWSQQAYIKASNTDAGDQFGHALALSGDTLAVSARFEGSAATGIGGDQGDNSAEWAGAVYVFTRNAGVWSQQAYIKASNTDAFDMFGRRVALSGDTLAVGADAEDSAATGIDGDQSDNSVNGSGAVYVFTRNAGVWLQQAYIKASNTDVVDRFGVPVALSGDTLAVSAYREDSNATGIGGDQGDNSADSAGAVYVFTRNAGVWSQQAYIKASNTDAGDAFGEWVALSGDRLAVGAPFEASNATGIDGDQSDNSVNGSGAVYVFTRNAGVWSQQDYVKASNTDAGDVFGFGVALLGDRLAVGAGGEASNATGIDGDQSDNSAFDAGAVYVFE